MRHSPAALRRARAPGLRRRVGDCCVAVPLGAVAAALRRVQLLLDSIGSVRSAVGPISSILGMAPGEARARGGAARNNDDVCALCHARTPGDPCRVCGHGSAATTDDAAAAAMVSGSAARHARRTRHRKRGLEARRRAIGGVGAAPATAASRTNVERASGASTRQSAEARTRSEGRASFVAASKCTTTRRPGSARREALPRPRPLRSPTSLGQEQGSGRCSTTTACLRVGGAGRLSPLVASPRK